MSTSELRAGPGGGVRRVVVYVAMAILAAAGIYGALSGAQPAMTLLAGIGVGVLWVVATRSRGDGR